MHGMHILLSYVGWHHSHLLVVTGGNMYAFCCMAKKDGFILMSTFSVYCTKYISLHICSALVTLLSNARICLHYVNGLGCL